MSRPEHVYRVGDRVHRVRGHPLADYRPTGLRGTVVGIIDRRPYLIRVRWDNHPLPHKSAVLPNLRGSLYHPDVLEPLSAIDLLGELPCSD